MSPRPKAEHARERGSMEDLIKAAARQQMAEHGTAGLSLRGIARALGITAPAIYNYFPQLDDLITALISDAFTELADAMDAAEAAAATARPYDKIMALCLAYRDWAMAHPTFFQLLYGNPIPGYHVPEALTVPLAQRPFKGLFRWFIHAYLAGELTIPDEYAAVPPVMAEAAATWKRSSGIEMPDALLALLMSGWSRIHGAVLLELFGHLEPMVGDGRTFYQYQLEAFAHLLKLGGRPDRASGESNHTVA